MEYTVQTKELLGKTHIFFVLFLAIPPTISGSITKNTLFYVCLPLWNKISFLSGTTLEQDEVVSQPSKIAVNYFRSNF